MTSACPLCESPDVRVVRTYTADQAAQHWASAEQEPVRHKELSTEISRLWGRQQATSNECNTCSFGFADPFVAGGARFYELAFGESGYPRDKWEFRRTIQALSQHECSDWNVLEIGAGGGYFLDQLQQVGIPPKQRYASEYNDSALKKMASRGYNVAALGIDELKSFGKRFNAVFMFQVLEHRDEIEKVFRTVHDLLEANGQLFIAVPNSKWARFYEANGSVLETPPNHVSQWHVSNFQQAADRFGFKIVSSDIEPFSLKRFVLQDTLFSFVRRAQSPGNLANVLYARRKQKLVRAGLPVALAANALRRMPFWLRKRKTIQALGENIWVQMERT